MALSSVPSARAVVPIGGEVFVAPRICPRDPSGELVRRASFAATRAHRHGSAFSLSGCSSSHHRSASLPAHQSSSPPSSEAAVASTEQLKASELASASAPSSKNGRRSRRLRNFNLVLPPEAQSRLDAWSNGQLPTISRPNPSTHNSKHSSTQSNPDYTLRHRISTNYHRALVGTEDKITLSTEANERTPELDSTSSSHSESHTVHTPSSSEYLMRPGSSEEFPTYSAAGKAISSPASEWYVKQDEYATRMHAFTGAMWNRERKKLERMAASGQKPTEPQTCRARNAATHRANQPSGHQVRSTSQQQPTRAPKKTAMSSSNPSIVSGRTMISRRSNNSPGRMSRFLSKLLR